MAERFGESVAYSSEKAPTSNGCFEVSAATPGVSPWPPPPVTEKNYTPEVGTLLWSKFNGDRRLAGPTVDELMCGIGDLIDLMTSAEPDEFDSAVKTAFEQRLVANKPKKKGSKGSSVLKKLVDKSK